MTAGTNQKLDRSPYQYFSSRFFKKPHFNASASIGAPMLALIDRQRVNFQTDTRGTLPLR